MKVSVVLDRAFSADRVAELGEAFWFLGSPHNRDLAKRLWATGRFDPNSAVFNDHRGQPLADLAAGILPTVILHHPDWDEIELIGLMALQSADWECFTQAHPMQIDELADGRIVLHRDD